MKTNPCPISAGIWLLAAVVLAGAPCAHADVITDANAKAADVASKHPATPVAVRTMAIVQVSVFEAVNAITGRYPTIARRSRRRLAPRWRPRWPQRRGRRC